KPKNEISGAVDDDFLKAKSWNKEKTFPQVKSSTHESHKHKKSKKSHKKMRKKKSHKNQKKSKKEATDRTADSSSEISEETGASSARKRRQPQKHKKKSREVSQEICFIPRGRKKDKGTNWKVATDERSVEGSEDN
ncbi:hypothetical protein FD755_024533, partial [Muntiacus reevesi]